MGSHLPSSPTLPIPEMFVEFAHIYADEVWSDEHSRSLEVVKRYLDDNCGPDSLVISAVLIDDLHVKENTLDITAFVRRILRMGIAPDHVVFEGKLAPIAQQILDELENHRTPDFSLKWLTFRKQAKKFLTYCGKDGEQIGLLTTWDSGKKEWSCAILSAAWSLCRAGVFEFPADSIIRLTEAPAVGQKIVSVLHEKYVGVENKVLRLISSIDKDEVRSRIEHVFFD